MVEDRCSSVSQECERTPGRVFSLLSVQRLSFFDCVYR